MDYYFGYIQAIDDFGFLDETDARVDINTMVKITEEERNQLLTENGQGKDIIFYNGEVFTAEPLQYIRQNNEYVLNPNYEADKQAQIRAEKDQMTLTPADVERALYKAKQMDFDDLKALIVQALPTIDIKALSIEFRAKDFYRGAEANGMRLFDVVGQLLGYTSDDMDYLFTHKELPTGETLDVDTTQ